VRDIAAPAAPAGLAVLPREGGLEVLWSPSAEPDLAGYRVYRATGDGRLEKLADTALLRASWLDETAVRGVVYRYAVTALDQAGNESEPTEPVEASLP
jgi:fibronectin type 3 domain-containing protein